MHDREPVEQRLALVCQVHEHTPTIVCVVLAAHKTARDGAIDELDGTVVLDGQPGGDVAHRRRLVGSRQAFEGEQELVLLGFDAGRVGGAFREVEEAAQLEAEASQRAVIDEG